MAKIWSYHNQEILDVKGLYYHCAKERHYRSSVLEHRRKPLKKYRRVSRIKIGVKVFLEGVNRANEEYGNEPMTSEVARSFGFCYNCGGQCPMHYKVDGEVA